MSISKVVEVIGGRKTGRTTKLKELWFSELDKSNGDVYVFFGTDIRAKETINYIWDKDHFIKVYMVSPLGDLVKFYSRHKVESIPRNVGLDRLRKERNIILFIDNISLNKTQDLVEDLCPELDIAELFYTGLSYHKGINRSILKKSLNVGDLGSLEYVKIYTGKGEDKWKERTTANYI